MCVITIRKRGVYYEKNENTRNHKRNRKTEKY